ncbi:MAG: DMT family transporter [Oscillospiraceae bacterium]|nr:DMT family transporter [Oscillospiraceae bacterium]
MSANTKNALMIAGMVISWSIYYAVSKVVVGATGSAFLAGFLLRASALVFLTLQLAADKNLKEIFRQGKTAHILLLIGVFGFLLDMFANLGYAKGSLSTGTALLKTDVLMVNLASVIIYKKKLYLSDWIGTFIMLFGVLLVLGISFGSIKFNITDLFFILSAVCVSANAFIIKSAQEKYGASTDMISYYNNFTVLVLFFIASAVLGDFEAMKTVNIPYFWPLVILGGLGQTGIYFFYYRNLKTHEVWQVKLYLLLMPVVSLFIGIFFLGEEMTPIKIAGIATVLLGASVIVLRDRINKNS